MTKYCLPHTGFAKYYNRDTLFRDVDWSNWAAVVSGFRSRIIDWYFAPLSIFPKTGHEAYPVFCSMCALIDTFTHYEMAKRGKKAYKDFLRNKLDPIFKTKLSVPIPVQGEGPLEDFADVFYTGVRCSLHHHGDLEPFAGMSRNHVLAKEIGRAVRSTCGSYLVPVVVFDPWILRDSLKNWFEGFCSDLAGNPRSTRAAIFRKQFEGDFAIAIPQPSSPVR